MAKKKKKTTSSRGRTTGRKTAAKKPSAQKKAATKKKTSRQSTRSRAASSAGKKKKPTGRKKTAKAVSRKKKVKTSKGTKKKTSKKSTTRKTTKKKTATKKKTSSKKKSGASAPSVSAKSKKKNTTKKAAEKAGSGSAAKGKNKRSQSVVEAASGAEADKHGYVFINGRRVRMISTQGKGIARKPKKPQAQLQEEEKPVEIKPGKSKLSKKELRHYRDLLLIKRAELVGDLSAMEAEALRSSGGNISHMPIHMADIGSDTYEQDFMLGMAEAERKQIREIDEALMRIQEGTYGVCHMTGKPIPKARLDAKPWAKYTIEAARKMEGHWQS